MNKKLYYYTCFVALIWVVIIFKIFANSINTNIFSSYKEGKKILEIIPQGWAFFTRSPREEMIDIYSVNKAGQLKIVTMHNIDAALGASRKARIINAELAGVAKQIPDSSWAFSRGVFKYKNDNVVKITGDSTSQPHYISKGDYVVVSHSLIPWAWASQSSTQIIYKAVRIIIK